ncbi:MAG TPA: LiaF domain-containing protein [Gemmatimonadaceae bacterium]|nr:LiaF domain-containing protein [Gemmatimonadaceae bacterium]
MKSMPDYQDEKQRAETRIPSASYVPAREDYPAADPATGIVSFLSSTERDGHFRVPRRMRIVAVMGNVELDLREAEIGLGVSVIEAVSVMGNIEITVPPDVAIECEGDALLGTFSVEYKGKVNTAAASRDKTIRITGNAYLASVTVRVKGPDEAMLARLGRTFGRHRR